MDQAITLILSRRMAQAYKEDEAKAIKHCAKNVFKLIKNPDMRNMILELAKKKTTDDQRVKAVKALEAALRVEKII